MTKQTFIDRVRTLLRMEPTETRIMVAANDSLNAKKILEEYVKNQGNTLVETPWLDLSIFILLTSSILDAMTNQDVRYFLFILERHPTQPKAYQVTSPQGPFEERPKEPVDVFLIHPGVLHHFDRDAAQQHEAQLIAAWSQPPYPREPGGQTDPDPPPPPSRPRNRF